ncbi:MAG: AEC family transporter [Candidatus Pacebacteria bacterium]|nr:AEC family transporter [Candidatus Paceibacterota bacterium]
MAFIDTFVSIVIGVFQTVLLVMAGVLLTKLKSLDPIGEMRFASANYYLLLPLLCAIQIANATSVDNLGALGILCIDFIVSCGITVVIILIYCRLAKVDIRTIKSYVMVATFGNVAFFPAIIVQSLCSTGGVLSSDSHCKYGTGYSMFGLFLLNIVVWIFGPFVISKDKVLAYNERRKMFLIKHFYGAAKDFLEDTQLAKVEEVQREKYQTCLMQPPVMSQSQLREDDTATKTELLKDAFLHPPPNDKEDLTVLEDPALIEFDVGLHMSYDVYEKFEERFDSFLLKLNPNVYAQIASTLPGPIKPLQMSFKFVLSKIITPPVISCIIGIVVGLITPLKTALLSENMSQRIFMNTFTSLGSMATNISVILLGAKLAGGFTSSKDINLRFVDLVAVNVLRMVIVPAIGLAFMWVMKEVASAYVVDDKVIAFVLYANWCVPPSVIVITLFLLVKYYTKELALIQFWTNVLSVFTCTAYLAIYFVLFPA